MLESLTKIFENNLAKPAYLSLSKGIAGPFSIHFDPFPINEPNNRRVTVYIVDYYKVLESTTESIEKDLQEWFSLAENKSQHTIEKVLSFFDELDVEFISSEMREYHPDVENPMALFSWYFSLYLPEIREIFHIIPGDEESSLFFRELNRPIVHSMKRIERK